MSRWEIERTYPIIERVKEISVAIDGFSYLVIFGKHINGGFCALPQEGISCELSAHDNFSNTGYNAANLNRKFKSMAKARAIAEAIHLAASVHEDEQDEDE